MVASSHFITACYDNNADITHDTTYNYILKFTSFCKKMNECFLLALMGAHPIIGKWSLSQWLEGSLQKRKKKFGHVPSTY